MERCKVCFLEETSKTKFHATDFLVRGDKKPPPELLPGAGPLCHCVGRSFNRELLAELLELVGDELDLGSDNDLDGGLTGTDDASSAGGLDDLLVNQQTVLALWKRRARSGSVQTDRLIVLLCLRF